MMKVATTFHGSVKKRVAPSARNRNSKGIIPCKTNHNICKAAIGGGPDNPAKLET